MVLPAKSWKKANQICLWWSIFFCCISYYSIVNGSIESNSIGNVSFVHFVRWDYFSLCLIYYCHAFFVAPFIWHRCNSAFMLDELIFKYVYRESIAPNAFIHIMTAIFRFCSALLFVLHLVSAMLCFFYSTVGRWV